MVSTRPSRWLRHDRLDALLVVVGVALRIIQYAYNRPFWLDEVSLGGNIVGRGVLDFGRPLIFEQLAPVGFLALERAAAQLLGPTTLTMRLLPLIGGVASVPLMAAVARRVLAPRAATLALALFALSDDLTYYASEMKPYSTDVALALLCLWLAPRDRDEHSKTTVDEFFGRLTLPWLTGPGVRLVALGVVGTLTVWLSFPAAFVLAGLGLAGFQDAIRRRRPGLAAAWIVIAQLWLASFAGSYRLATAMVAPETRLWVFWDFSFPRRPATAAGLLTWAIRSYCNLFINPFGFHTPLGAWASAVPPALLFVLGAVAVGRSRPPWAVRLVVPLAAALLAGACRLSPCYGRLVLFLAPTGHLLVAAGVDALARGLGRRSAFTVLAAALLTWPILTVLYHLVEPRLDREFNPHGDLRPDILVLAPPASGDRLRAFTPLPDAHAICNGASRGRRIEGPRSMEWRLS
ncbi:MAG TPA: hypothetical protein VG406_10740 [Isosphaeraceae bacterium]|jgi:hypothetical protein|nr:hypothetical protein [Isosphaeraceae bacterium]